MDEARHEVPTGSPPSTPPDTSRPGRFAAHALRVVILASLVTEAAYMVARFGDRTRGMDALLLPMCLQVVLPVFAMAHVPAWRMAHRVSTEPACRVFTIALMPLLVTFALAFALVAGDWDKLWFPVIATVPTMLVLAALRVRFRMPSSS